jgi:hypothetical protein
MVGLTHLIFMAVIYPSNYWTITAVVRFWLMKKDDVDTSRHERLTILAPNGKKYTRHRWSEQEEPKFISLFVIRES